MTRTALALSALLSLAACADEDPKSAYPDASSLYRIEGADLFCDGGEVWRVEPETPPHLSVICAWTCLAVDGRDVTRVDVTFRRDADGAPWRQSFVGWNFGTCD